MQTTGLQTLLVPHGAGILGQGLSAGGGGQSSLVGCGLGCTRGKQEAGVVRGRWRGGGKRKVRTVLNRLPASGWMSEGSIGYAGSRLVILSGPGVQLGRQRVGASGRQGPLGPVLGPCL